MLHRSRLTFISFVILLALVVPTNLVQAQSTPQASIDKSAAPTTNLAVPDEVAEVAKVRESLTAEQISKVQAILDSHKAEFQQIRSDLASLEALPSEQDKKLFLPFINANGSANDEAQSQTTATDTTASAEKVAKIRQIELSLNAVQNKIDQEVATVLTAAQNAVYAKSAAKLKSTGQSVSARLQTLTASSTESNSDCSDGAYYGAKANYYGHYGLLFSFYNYWFWSYTDARYYAYLYAHYAYPYLTTALPLAGGAAFDAYYGLGYDSYAWSDTATPAFYNAYYYFWYARANALADYNNTGNHDSAWSAYYYNYWAQYYSYQAYNSEYYC